MYARVTTTQSNPDQIDEATNQLWIDFRATAKCRHDGRYFHEIGSRPNYVYNLHSSASSVIYI